MAQTLAASIKYQQWELVALLVLLGMIRTLERLPPDALPALLDLLGETGAAS